MRYWNRIRRQREESGSVTPGFQTPQPATLLVVDDLPANL